MNDDERRRPIERIVQTVVFALVAVVVITSVALPILATAVSMEGVEGTPAGNILSVIPVLLIVAAVIWVIRKSGMSDR